MAEEALGQGKDQVASPPGSQTKDQVTSPPASKAREAAEGCSPGPGPVEGADAA
jgi:hypothetical protein